MRLCVTKLANDADQYAVYNAGDGQTVAVTHYDIGGRNAELFAVAPEILEALQDLMVNLDEMGLATMPGDTFENMRETADRARALIARIEEAPIGR